MSDKFKDKYRIPSTRLRGYDYGQSGAYFITICTKNRIPYLGEIQVNSVEAQDFAPSETHNNASLRPTLMGEIAIEYWKKISEHFPFVVLDEFQIMPNHLHGIIIIDKPSSVETQYFASLQSNYKNKFGPQSGNLSSIVRGYKAAVKSFATTNKIQFEWQPRFHDHIIRNHEEMSRISQYIAENPGNWSKDRDNEEGLFM